MRGRAQCTVKHRVSSRNQDLSLLCALQVRSCTLDTWLPGQVSFMAATGNAAANAYWEAKLTSSQKPHYESPDLQPFIRRKYCNKEFAEGEWPPAAAHVAASQTTPPGRQAQTGTVSSSVSIATPEQPQQQQSTAGRSEAGGYWGSLTPQESLPNHGVTPEGSVGLASSPALLIDLMDFGAESTFQLPTTPRRRPSGTAHLMFDSPADVHTASTPSSSVPSQHNAAQASSSNQAGASANSARQPGTSGAAQPAVVRQRSNFPYFPPPPQITRQLGPPQPAQPPALPHHAGPPPPAHSDMAVNTDGDLGGLEGLILQADSGHLDPFSQSLHSSLDLAAVPQMVDSLPAQQNHDQPQRPGLDQSHTTSPYGMGNNSLQGQQGQGQLGLSVQPLQGSLALQQGAANQPQPIFFQGQWFTPAPANFVPPPHLSSFSQQSVSQQQPMWQLQQQQQQQQQQQGFHSMYQHQAQQQQQQSIPSSWDHSAVVSGRDVSSGAWSPTHQGQFESPTFRDGAVKPLAPGPSGRTWSPSASDVTRLTLPSSHATTASSQPKVVSALAFSRNMLCCSSIEAVKSCCGWPPCRFASALQEDLFTIVLHMYLPAFPCYLVCSIYPVAKQLYLSYCMVCFPYYE